MTFEQLSELLLAFLNKPFRELSVEELVEAVGEQDDRRIESAVQRLIGDGLVVENKDDHEVQIPASGYQIIDSGGTTGIIGLYIEQAPLLGRFDKVLASLVHFKKLDAARRRC